MRMPWDKAKEGQLDLVDAATADALKAATSASVGGRGKLQLPDLAPMLSLDAVSAEGIPLPVPVGCLEEDPADPRTEFPTGKSASSRTTSPFAASSSPSSCAGLPKRVATASCSARNVFEPPSRPSSTQFLSASARPPMTFTLKSPRTRSVMV
jgi:hypothetical protein